MQVQAQKTLWRAWGDGWRGGGGKGGDVLGGGVQGVGREGYCRAKRTVLTVAGEESSSYLCPLSHTPLKQPATPSTPYLHPPSPSLHHHHNHHPPPPPPPTLLFFQGRLEGTVWDLESRQLLYKLNFKYELSILWRWELSKGGLGMCEPNHFYLIPEFLHFGLTEKALFQVNLSLLSVYADWEKGGVCLRVCMCMCFMT